MYSQLTPKRPLRSEVEREKRLSRPTSIASSNNNIRSPVSIDAHSLSGDSNRNSIGNNQLHFVQYFNHFNYFRFCFSVTTDSTTSEEDAVPPPLPAKTRDSTDFSSAPPSFTCTMQCQGNENYSTVRVNWERTKIPTSPICVDNATYEYVGLRDPYAYDDKRKPPTPP